MLGWRRRRDEAQRAAAARAHVAQVLRSSGLVDADYYRETCPEAAQSAVDPVDHYAAAGGRHLCDPNPFFESAWYLEANPDVRDAGLNPLYHYIVSGAAEGRGAGPAFDTAYYVAQNPDVQGSGINPLLHYIRHGRAEGRIAVPFDDGEAFETGLSARAQGIAGPAAALFSGPRADHVHFAFHGRGEPSGHRLPLPPLRLAQRIGSKTLEDFEESGHDIRQTILRTLPEDWDWNGKRCLDFGSGVGRAMRHFRPEAEQAEFWGCDIDGSSIRWSVQNLSPPFRFVQIGEVPTLPFEDGSFDLVTAVSVLTHIHSTWHQWLAEIRRILKPGGFFVATFLGPTPMGEIVQEPYWGRDDFGMYVKAPFNAWKDGGPMIFVSPDWLKAFWGSLFDIDYIAIDGLMDYQSLLVARKPAAGMPIRTDVPVLHPGTDQVFDRDAVGRIHPQVDLRRPYRSSYGVDVPAASAVAIAGWMVFRGDAAICVEVTVDGRSVCSEVSLEPGETYRDWSSPVVDFSATLDLSLIAIGVHRLEAIVASRGGRTHRLAIPLLIR